MNRILCMVIAVSLILTSGISVFSASDYQGHWSENIIETLISDNVISGDDSGIRPDDSILRSEFITIINKVFSYTSEGATVNFPDVQTGKWYFTQFLAAKKAGYLTGDENGNANPESRITRAEVAVILCRILGFKPEINTTFIDDSSIPSWSRDAIYALSAEGVIKGYPDGSFNPSASMTRAEAFSVIFNVKNLNTENTENITSANVNLTTENKKPQSSGGGGGSSGGGGGSSSSSGDSFKITRVDNENYIIAWSSLSSVKSYTVIVTSERTGASSEAVTGDLYFNYKEVADHLSEEGRKNKEAFTITVKAGSKKLSSKVTVSYLSVPEVDDITTYCEPLNGEERIYVSFSVSPLAESYDFKIDLGSGEEKVEYNVINGKAVADITSVLDIENQDEFSYSIKGISADNNVLDSENISGKISKPLYFSGKGTEENPYIIKNTRHFKNIEKNNKAYYILASDIVLPSDYVPFEFNGSLVGDDKNNYREITVNIVGAAGANVGLFTQATVQGTTVQYITLKGSVKGSGKWVGGFFGVFAIAGNLSYCKNYADIESTGDRTGGFVGKASIEGALTNLINYGNIKASGGAGGIAGEAHGGSYLANLGNVSGGWYTGGIFGVSTTSVSNSFNKGVIKGAYNVGGIVGCGSGSGKKITACYNTGNVIQSMDKYTSNQSGGILGGVNGTSSGYIVISCYNTGVVTPASGAVTPIIPKYEAQSCITAADCVYTSEGDDELAGTEKITVEELKNHKFESDIFFIDSSSGYLYPQITGFTDVSIPKKLATPNVSATADRNGVVIAVSGQAETTMYKIMLSESSDFENYILISNNGGSSLSLDITSYLEGYETYYVRVSAVSNSPNWLESDSVEISCAKPYYRLSKPSLTVTRPGNSEILLNISGQEETEEYLIYFSEYENFPDNENTNFVSVSEGYDINFNISDKLNLGVKCYIKVIAKGDGINWHDSEAVVTEYTKEAYKIDTPVLSEAPYYENNGYVISWNRIEAENLAGYIITVSDGGNVVYTDDSVSAGAVSAVISETAEMPFGEKTYTITLVAKGGDASENSKEVSATVDTRFGGGEGTKASPYYICNDVHFKNIALYPSADYILRDDIDLTDCGYLPIESFSGVLSGFNNELKTIELNILSSEINVGVFEKAENATFEYIALSGKVESQKNSTYSQIGGFAGKGSGTLVFNGCVNNAEITSIKSKTGGFIGQADYMILSGCVNNGAVTVTNGGNAGGFVGKATTVYNGNSVNNGTVTANSNYGDIAGSGTVENSLPEAEISLWRGEE